MSDLRETVNAVLDTIEDGPVKALVAEVFSTTSTKKVWHTLTCRECGQKQRDEVEVEVPSAKLGERTKALQILLAEGKGRPAEHKTHTVNIGVRYLSELQELSDAELAAIGSGEAEVAEWSEVLALPPASS